MFTKVLLKNLLVQDTKDVGILTAMVKHIWTLPLWDLHFIMGFRPKKNEQIN